MSDLLSNIITEDEAPLSRYLPETKRESSEWKLPGEKPSKKNAILNVASARDDAVCLLG